MLITFLVIQPLNTLSGSTTNYTPWNSFRCLVQRFAMARLACQLVPLYSGAAMCTAVEAYIHASERWFQAWRPLWKVPYDSLNSAYRKVEHKTNKVPLLKFLVRKRWETEWRLCKQQKVSDSTSYDFVFILATSSYKKYSKSSISYYFRRPLLTNL